MGEPFIGEIRMISFNFAPRGWAFCNGQLLPINQNQALFSILGTTYGGNGQTNFALPNLQGRSPIHVGSGISLGEVGGETSHTLTTGELPAHSHPPAAKGAANATSPAGAVWADGGSQAFGAAANVTMNTTGVSTVGGSQAHNNMPPYLSIYFVIALVGIFPSRN